ncbi:Sec-independent protein translocase subunit TatA [Immundisolibacter sp.]|uniref:Sec-independent protein translocase subunit TatA n=1 Tax=Immundisolibacter sp. TaxID=1934948 RepID=UPI002602A7FB|nr:Sec-independent protein translocase subunit TatA [Immundisolibacter sp.]MDD3651807.1 Sec-independent protein translocase subunit TatA [Immundisolibacter sp.]
MGIEGISPFRLLIILAIVLVLFGGKRLRSLGGDLGGAIKGFKNAMKEGEQESAAEVERLNDARPADASAASQAKRERQDG